MQKYKEERIEELKNYCKARNGQLVDGYDYIFKNKQDNALFDYVVDENRNVLINKNDNNREYKIDYRANNMTSSSMLSACFFAYYHENQDEFKKIIEETIGVKINGNIDVLLEYVDSKKNNKKHDIKGIDDSTHFDAVLLFSDTCNKKFTIFVEVKYCEDKYGKKNYNKDSKLTEEENHKKYIDSCISQFEKHKDRLNIDGYLNEEKKFIKYIDSDYSKYYQIIRMISHASYEDNCYCLFLVPKNNINAVDDINDGLDKLKENNLDLINDKVRVLYFEDILDKDNDLYKKYFK